MRDFHVLLAFWHWYYSVSSQLKPTRWSLQSDARWPHRDGLWGRQPFHQWNCPPCETATPQQENLKYDFVTPLLSQPRIQDPYGTSSDVRYLRPKCRTRLSYPTRSGLWLLQFSIIVSTRILSAAGHSFVWVACSFTWEGTTRDESERKSKELLVLSTECRVFRLYTLSWSGR